MLREQKMMERVLKEHLENGYEAPPIRNGMALTALRNVK